MANTDPKRVVTGVVRLSYAHLTKPRPPRQGDTGDPKYSVTLLIPKSDVATMQRIQAAMQAAINEGVTSTWGGVRPPQPAIPIYDGDGVRPASGEAFGPECKGHYVLTASSKQQPQIVDTQMNPIVNATEIYSGMYAHVSFRFFAYNSNGKKGIGAGLGNVQKVADGEPLAGGASAADDFGGMTAPMAPQPGFVPQQPVQSPYPQQPQYQPQQQPQQPLGYGQYHQQQVPMIDFYSKDPVPQAAPPAPAQQLQQQIDPITGKPMLAGGIMGIGK